MWQFVAILAIFGGLWQQSFLKQQPSAKEIIFEIISLREKICRHWELNCEPFDPYVMTNYATVLPTIFSKKC